MQFVTDHVGMTVDTIKPRGGTPQPNGQISYDLSNGFDDPGEPSLHFSSRHVTQAHVDWALKNFGFAGMPYDPDTDEPLSPWYRVGVLDTDEIAALRGWSPDRKRAVEDALLNNPDHGSLYKVYVPEKLPPPWPTYDEMRGRGRGGATTADMIVEFAVRGGYDLAAVIAYEQQNRNREDVVAALRAKLEEPAEETIEVSA